MESEEEGPGGGGVVGGEWAKEGVESEAGGWTVRQKGWKVR